MKQIVLGFFCILLLTSIVKSDYENIADEDSFIMTIIKSHDPEGKLYFSKSTYTLVLQDIIKTGMNLAGQGFEQKKIELLMQSIDDFVQSKPEELENLISYKDVFGDLTSQFVIFLQENIKKYQVPYEMMYGESEILPPQEEEDSATEPEKKEEIDDL